MKDMPIVDLPAVTRELAESGKRVKVLWQEPESLAFVARGREYRSEFHVNASDELTYMIKGTMHLHYRTPEGKEDVLVIPEGSTNFMPSNVPHSPRFPPEAFAMIVERCENYLEEKVKLVDPNESDSWYDYRTEQYTSMRTIISAAQRLAVEPFSSLTVPTRAGFERSNDFQEFKHDVDHYLTQFVLDRAIREKRESVVVAPAVKDRLRAHIQAMRSHIDGANLSDSKRAKLHAKLTEFEQSLEKDRIPIFKMARFLIEILSISANVVGLAESHTMAKLTANIMETFAEAKAADDESRRPLQIEHQPFVALPPKRAVGIKKPRETFDLDDEIPF